MGAVHSQQESVRVDRHKRVEECVAEHCAREAVLLVVRHDSAESPSLCQESRMVSGPMCVCVSVCNVYENMVVHLLGIVCSVCTCEC